jgi:polyhydroxyalkanoate synthesis regulator phasin
MTEASGRDSGDQQESTAAGIRDLIERTFLVGLGAAALTKEKIQGLVEEFVRRGQISGDEGRDMVERLVARSKEETQSALKKADTHLSGTFRDIGLATRRDLEDIDFRLRQLEHRVRLLESAADETASSESGSISQ